MKYPTLQNTKSPEMCEFFIMLFIANNKAHKTPELIHTMRVNLHEEQIKQCRKNIKALILKKEKVECMVDRLSGHYAIPNENAPKLRKCFELYNTINNSIEKQKNNMEYVR